MTTSGPSWWPELGEAVMRMLVESPGLTVREIASAIDEPPHRAYQAIIRLEAAGRVRRNDSWPRKVFVCEADDNERNAGLHAIGELLSEAMTLPEWSQTPGPVRHKIEHAWVQLMRERSRVDG